MTPFQTANFYGLPLIGVDAVIARGTKPGVFRLRLPHDQSLNLDTGQLTITSDETVTFNGVRPDLSTVRVETTVDNKREWVIVARDRRELWSQHRVSGVFNRRRRDNSIIGASTTATTLANDALIVAGEAGGSNAPPATPTVDWEYQTVAEALDGLSAILPVHVCRTASDAFIVQQTGTGASLPTAVWNAVPIYLARIDKGPKTIKVRCGPTWYHCGLDLEAVGEDTDGEYKTLANLSYKPTTWSNEWPTLFSGVAQNNRPLAFQTVLRYYRIKTDMLLPFESYTLEDLDEIKLDDHRLVFDADRNPPATVIGTFWPYSDHYVNTADCPIHSGDFELDKEHRMIRFEYPIWKQGSCVDEADLKLYTAFHLRYKDTGDWMHEEFTYTRATGEGEQVIHLPFLWRARAFQPSGTCAEGTTESDNLTDLTTEAQVYLDAWKDHWDTVRDKRFMWYTGTHQLALSGNIAEITYRIGRGLPPYTRASEHFRHSLVRA